MPRPVWARLLLMGARRSLGWLTGLLGLVLAVLAVAAVLTSRQQTQIVARVAATSNVTDAYQQAAYLAAREMALIEASLRAPDGPERRQIPRVDGQVAAALTRMVAADAGNSMPARILATEHLNLDPDIQFYLLQLDRNDQAGARRTLQSTIEPAYNRFTDGLLDAQSRHLAASSSSQAAARQVSRRLMWGSAGIFLLGLATLCLFGWSIRAHRREVEATAATDPLTGLPNRSAFTAAAQRALSGPRAREIGLLLVDLDGFRTVNDQFGHSIGDQLLIETGRRLTKVARADDLIARLGGDEFAVLLPGADPETGRAVAGRLAQACAAPFTIGELAVDLEVSVGAAIAQPGDDATALLQHADAALHTAKHEHTGFHEFSAREGDGTSERLNLLGDLRRALEDPGQILLHYQPQIDLRSGALTGVEALARWQHPARGMTSPGEFIPVLENTSMIHQFTDVVLIQAIAQARAWLDSGHRIPVAVNISSRSLLGTALPDRLAALLADADLPGDLLCIEITEHTVMRDPPTAIEILQRIRALGVRISIDDYGTGYSSMTYLKLLPVDELKIDRSFVDDMTTDSRSHALVASTIDLGHNLGLTVIAEGVENAATADALCQAGCDTAQGYHFARPAPAEALTDQIESAGSSHHAAGPPRRPAPMTGPDDALIG
jgi:diguanylate cyclase (GGDEF)-like protein